VIFVDRAYVEPIDPLFLTPEFHLFDLDERAGPCLRSRAGRGPQSRRRGYMGAIRAPLLVVAAQLGSVDKQRDAVGLNAMPDFRF